MASISINHTYAGKHVLLTGASGFLGKIWLAMMLDRVPEIGCIHVLIRKKGLRPAVDRFEKMVGSSYAFKNLHERFGEELSTFIAQRVEVVEGDVSLPNFGLEESVAQRLRTQLDLVVNCAGLVDFNPDLRDALGTNVNGGLHAAEFVRSCQDAALLHVSTCYVVGNRSGLIEEEVHANYAPANPDFDSEAEFTDLQQTIDDVTTELESSESEEELKQEVLDKIRRRGLDESNATLIRNMTHRQRQQRLKNRLAEEGERRALAHGWPNTYTYTKSLAESLIARRADGLKYTMFRPAIVESALSYPFPGWNEGFNTCGPLSYLMQTWFRHLPAKAGNPFDVIPVDLVCNAIAIAGAALMLGEHKPVYHCGTSDRNPLTIGRACELVSLAHRKHLRKSGSSAMERVVLSRLDGVCVEGEHLLSVPNIRSVSRGIVSTLRGLSERAPDKLGKSMDEWASATEQADRQLDVVEKMLDLFRPFIHDNRFVFRCRGFQEHDVEEAAFRFEPESIDWRHYWLNIHIPGLRRWSYPAIEGKRVETYTPEVAFVMPGPNQAQTDATVTHAKREVG
jgi:long-chain acyl-CoA synthetase